MKSCSYLICHLQLCEDTVDYDFKADIQDMLSKGECVNDYLNSRATPLIIAISNMDISYVQKLISAGADVNLPTKEGVTPVCLSLQSLSLETPEYIHILHALLEAGADAGKGCVIGDTPLIHAVEQQSKVAAGWLMSYGADVDGLSRNGETALHYAARRGKEDSVIFLLEAGAKLNIPSWTSGERYGAYPLTSALFRKCHHIVLMLLGAGAEINVVSAQGCPLTMSAWIGWPQLTQYLLRKNAFVNIAKGITAKDLIGNNITRFHKDSCVPPCYVLLYIAGEQLDYFESLEFLKEFSELGCEWFLRKILLPTDISRERVNTYVRNFIYREEDDDTVRTVQNHRDKERSSQFIRYIHEHNFTLRAIARRAVRTHLLVSNPPYSLFTKVDHLVRMQQIPLELREYLLYGFNIREQNIGMIQFTEIM